MSSILKRRIRDLANDGTAVVALAGVLSCGQSDERVPTDIRTQAGASFEAMPDVREVAFDMTIASSEPGESGRLMILRVQRSHLADGKWSTRVLPLHDASDKRSLDELAEIFDDGKGLVTATRRSGTPVTRGHLPRNATYDVSRAVSDRRQTLPNDIASRMPAGLPNSPPVGMPASISTSWMDQVLPDRLGNEAKAAKLRHLVGSNPSMRNGRALRRSSQGSMSMELSVDTSLAEVTDVEVTDGARQVLRVHREFEKAVGGTVLRRMTVQQSVSNRRSGRTINISFDRITLNGVEVTQ